MSDNVIKNATPLWRWPELSDGLQNTAAQGPDVAGVVVDSRLIRHGDLFVALPGDPGPRFNPSYRSNVDGHDFVNQAALQGAAGAIVHKPRTALDVPDNFPLIEVKDTYDGLWALGHMARARLQGEVVAITGSSGKTTAKRFISAALDAYAPPGSFNNHIGVPLSLANAPPASQFCVLEIGTNHPGEILPLAEMADADIAVLLNVHSAHIENFSGREDLILEKSSIFRPLRDKSNAISEDLLELGFGLTFGLQSHADARVVNLTGDRVDIDLMGRRIQARVPGGGLHRASTVAATLLVCQQLEQDLGVACDLPVDVVPQGRGNIRQIAGRSVVDDSYNANPESMRAALESFSSLYSGIEKIAVIGEMLELGNQSDQAHMQLLAQLQTMDQVYCVGKGAQKLAQALGAPWFNEAGPSLLEQITSTASPTSAIFIKGSNRVFWAKGFVDALCKDL